MPRETGSRQTMQVVVKQEGSGPLSVRWNSQSAPIARAREGRLVVLEGNRQPKVVHASGGGVEDRSF